MNWKKIQEALKSKGFNPGPIDGIPGPLTEQAIIDFKISQSLRARPYIGPITLSRLGLSSVKSSPASAAPMLPVPWINEMMKYYLMHEEDPALAAWLASDGKTVGDPDDIAWCGDAGQTSIANTLPNEPWPGRVGQNPYLALNWLDFGIGQDRLYYGAACSFWRKNPRSIFGHLAFAIGYDPKRKRIRILGGNQTDRVTKTWIDEKRLRKHGIRWPSTYEGSKQPIPIMNSAGQVISTNEA